jgi:hypothetical protein
MANITTIAKGTKGSFIAVNHDDLYATLKSALPSAVIEQWTKPSRTKAAAAVGGGERVLYRLKLDKLIPIVETDVVRPMIQLRDQTFPGAALQVEVGLYRLVCTNGLMAFSREFTPLRIPHYASRRDQLAAIADTVLDSLGRVAATVERAHHLTTVAVADPLAVLSQLELPKKVHDTAAMLITTGLHRKEDDPKNAWGLYNIINEVDAVKSRSRFAALSRDLDMTTKILTLVK